MDPDAMKVPRYAAVTLPILAICAVLFAVRWLSGPPSGSPEPGPPPGRLEGEWIADQPRFADIPGEFRAQSLAWRDLRLRFADDAMTVESRGASRQGPCSITSYPPVFYLVEWHPDGGAAETWRLGLTSSGVNVQPAGAGGAAVPMRRAVQP